MVEEEFCVFELESHETKDVSDSHINGELTVIWRDWDNVINEPKMIYVNSISPREIKGPHVHKKRTSTFFCTQGRIIIIIQDKNGEYHEIESSAEDSKLISISNGVGTAIINPTDQITKVLVLADVSWKPNDDEMKNTTFDNYNWAKWKDEEY